jgi:AcrR family transcriptional regulator
VNARRRAVRDQIIRSAADLFREKGYRASTLDDIAARLSMSKATLYTYFRAKEEMLAAQKDHYDKGVESVVLEGTRRGVFREMPPRLVVFGLLGMLNWVYKWYNPAGRWGAEEVSAAFLALIEDGLLRSARRGPRLESRLKRLRRELGAVVKALED